MARETRKRGKFFVFEGIDGSGKSTRAKIALKYIKKQNIDVLFLTEPAQGLVGEAIRALVLKAELSMITRILLFSANRAQSYETVINPALAKGTWIVMDRSWLSTIVYQGWGESLGNQIILNDIDNITKMIIKDLNFDLCILCDIDPEIALQRILRRGQEKDYFEKQRIEFITRMRKGYLDAISRYPHLKFLVLDTGKNISGDEKMMNKEIEDIIKPYLGGDI